MFSLVSEDGVTRLDWNLKKEQVLLRLKGQKEHVEHVELINQFPTKFVCCILYFNKNIKRLKIYNP